MKNFKATIANDVYYTVLRVSAETEEAAKSKIEKYISTAATKASQEEYQMWLDGAAGAAGATSPDFDYNLLKTEEDGDVVFLSLKWVDSGRN